METRLGNQQATDIELAYLAGVWDGEGSIQLARNGSADKYQARIKMTNTGTLLIQRVVEILDRMGVPSFVNVSNPKGNNGNNKTAYNVVISSRDAMIRFCEVVSPYLVDKKPHAFLMLRYLESRKRSGKRSPYSGDERAAFDALKSLNGRGASTTARATAERLKIQSELARDGEKSAEMTDSVADA